MATLRTAAFDQMDITTLCLTRGLAARDPGSGARHGEHDQARAAILAAAEASASAQQDDVHAGVAGEFAFD